MNSLLKNKEQEEKKIDLTPFRGGEKSTVFTGKPQGLETRKKLKLNELDRKNVKISIEIPSGTTSLNPSFFLGLLYDSIKLLGNRFEDRYSLIVKEQDADLKKEIEKNIQEGFRYAKNFMNKRIGLAKFRT